MRLAAVALATTIVLSGCGTTDETPGAGGQDRAANDQWGPLAVQPPQQGWEDARAGGTLRITEHCVFLQHPHGEDELLVWPADRTRWDGESRTIIFEDLDAGTVTLADGDAVISGGGGGSFEESGTSSEEWASDFEWVSPPAQECLTDAHWFIGGIQLDRLEAGAAS